MIQQYKMKVITVMNMLLINFSGMVILTLKVDFKPIGLDMDQNVKLKL